MNIKRILISQQFGPSSIALSGVFSLAHRTGRADRAGRSCRSATRKHAPLHVVGEPGAGKSGALHDVTDRLLETGVDVVLLAADRAAASNLGALRQSLGLEHEIVDVLESRPGSGPAFPIVDGLDAARAESAGRTLRDLIRLVIQDATR